MAARDKSVANSVCLNHPDRPADTRCTTCHKPICNECAIRDGNNVFCSDQCRENYDSTRENVEAFQERKRREKRRKMIKRLIILIILIAIGAAAYKYFADNPDDLKKLREKTDSLRQKAGEVVDEAKEK